MLLPTAGGVKVGTARRALPAERVGEPRRALLAALPVLRAGAPSLRSRMRHSTLFAGLALGVALAGSCAGEVGWLPGDEPGAVEADGGDAGTFDAGDGSDAGPGDAGGEDAGTPDSGAVDAGAGDAGGGDAGVAVDAGPGDAGVVDAGARDAGAADAGRVDAGTLDAGVADAGQVDAGAPDAGAVDAGPGDAGVVDAGSLDAGLPPDCWPLQGVVTTLAKGTYCVTGDVIVPTGVTLDIPAGTTFIVMGRYHFGRDPAIPDLEPPAIAGSGTIHAIGTAAEPIIFRGATPSTGWFGIVVSHSHDTVHFEYVTVRDTYKDDHDPSSRIWRRGGALGSYVNAKGTILRHCTFVNNRAWSVAGAVDLNSHGQWPNQGPVEITDSLFEDNTCECGVYSFSSSDLCGGGAIRVSHIGGDATLVKFRNNVFRHNQSLRTTTIDAYGGALGGFDSAVIIGPGHVFDGNHASTGDGALSCSHQAGVGTIISAIDATTVFTNNTPDNGCGQ